MAQTDQERPVIWVRGIPWSKNEHEVTDWFSGKNVTVHDGCFGVYFVYQSTGIPRGDCYIQLESDADVEVALQLNKCQFGERYVEIHRSSWSELTASLGSFCRGPDDAVIRVRGLPFSTREDEIFRYFKGYDVSMVKLCPNEAGRPSGDAFVRFGNKSEAKRSFDMHRQMLGERYIELFLASEGILQEFEKNKFVSTGTGNNYERTFTSTRPRGGASSFRRGSFSGYSLSASPLLSAQSRQGLSPMSSSGSIRPGPNFSNGQIPANCLSPTLFPPGFNANGMSPQPPPSQPASSGFLSGCSTRGSPSVFVPGPAPCQLVLNDANNSVAAWTDFSMNNDPAMQRYVQAFTDSFNNNMQLQQQQLQAANNFIAEQIQQNNTLAAAAAFEHQQHQQQPPMNFYNSVGPATSNGGMPMPLSPQTILMPPPMSLAGGMPMSPFFPLVSPVGGGPSMFPVSPFVMLPPFTPNGVNMPPQYVGFFPTVNDRPQAPPPPPPPSTPMQFPPPQNIPWTPSA